MKVEGKSFAFGDNVNTDEIIPARYLVSSDPAELALYCMEDIRPGFGKRGDIKKGIIVAGENFGCGSSREHAPMAIKAAGIQCVIANSFARIFLRNSFNTGLLVIETERTPELKEGDLLEIDTDKGVIVNRESGEEITFKSLPPFIGEIVDAGGWLNYLDHAEEGDK